MQYTYAKNKYGKYAIPVGMEDTIICNTLIADSGVIWERDTLDYIENQTLQGDIIHAGAFIGDFVPCLSSLVPNYKVICFEPSELNYKACLETIKINNLNNVELHQRVLGDVNSIVKFLVSYEGKPEGPMSAVTTNDKYGIDTECITLDSILDQDRPVTLIHLDVEGYETKALQGAVNTIERFKPLLLIEKYKQQEQDSFFNFLLNDLGYVDSGEVGGNRILVTKK